LISLNKVGCGFDRLKGSIKLFLARALQFRIHTQYGGPMGNEDKAAGKIKQLKGKGNDVAGAVKGDTGQQLKGKVQQAVGKAQEKLGKAK
jgi:uncharacterized protein YjbJ (UPF0337 family)